MANQASQALFLPFLFSLIVFLLITFVLVPATRRYRERYSQYLPVHAISDGTSALRSRFSNRLGRLGGALRARFAGSQGTVFTGEGGALDGGASDSGEELAGLEREVLRTMERRSQSGIQDNERRLSVEYVVFQPARRDTVSSVADLSSSLEQGFRDDSSDDDSDS